METLVDLERQERELRMRLQDKKMEFDGETILKGDAVESLPSIDYLSLFFRFCDSVCMFVET